MDKNTLKRRVAEAIEERSQEITSIGEDILRHPELGFKEYRTAGTVESVMKNLGLSPKTGVALTGVRGEIHSGRKGPHIALFGELDSVISWGHPFADPGTGAAHACGHNAQVAGMLGAAMGLQSVGAMNHLSGRVTFFGVPAEELVEIEFREQMRRQGKIQYLLGKQQLIAEGELEGVDIGMMFHLESRKQNVKVSVGGSHNGAMAKFVRYRGKEAHAGSAPHLGINALNAALLGMMGIHAQRETFQDSDSVRIHPIITKGGDVVNTVPSDVTLELFVRARTLEAIGDAAGKVNRAMKAGADAIGATCEISSLPGYMPRRSFTKLDEVFMGNARVLVGDDAVDETEHRPSCTDMGDVSQMMPALHPYFRAAEGKAHGETFLIVDKKLAYIASSIAMAWTVIDLLYDEGRLGYEIAKAYNRTFSNAADYVSGWDKVLA